MTGPAHTRRAFLTTAAASLAIRGAPLPYATPFKYGKLVLAASLEKDAFDSHSVDCPFVFQRGGLFYMTYIGWDGTGYQTGLASSADLVHWRKLGCILRRDPKSLVTRYNIAMNWIVRDNALRSPGHLRKIRGRFLGVYHAYPAPGLESGPAVIGLCRSDDLRRWELEGPCLIPQEGAAWERGGLYKPCLVEQGGEFYLFYNAKTSEQNGWREQTGVATSKDLKNWKRFEGNPILPNGGAGSWDEKFASDPCVVIDGARWAMFYYGLDAKGKARDLLATRASPFRLTKVNEILVDAGAPGSVDETYAHKPSVVWHDGALYHFYCAVSGKYPDETRGIAVAARARGRERGRPVHRRRNWATFSFVTS
jgi:predicted GH43/DUF377 family glycosyl hydrolase